MGGSDLKKGNSGPKKCSHDKSENCLKWEPPRVGTRDGKADHGGMLQSYTI